MPSFSLPSYADIYRCGSLLRQLLNKAGIRISIRFCFFSISEKKLFEIFFNSCLLKNWKMKKGKEKIIFIKFAPKRTAPKWAMLEGPQQNGPRQKRHASYYLFPNVKKF